MPLIHVVSFLSRISFQGSVFLLPFSHCLRAGSPAMAAFSVSLTHARRDQASQDVSDSSLRIWVMVFNILSAMGFLALAAVFLTVILSPSVKRVSTWYSYIVAWMVFCITPFLVIGHQTHFDHPPSFAPCVVDSALMYASRPFAAFATLSLILQLYLNVSTRLNRGEVRPESVYALLVIPPMLYLIMFLWTFIRGIVIPDQVELEPGGFYCHLSGPLPAIVGGALVGLATTAALFVEVLIVTLLCRNWRAFRALQRCGDHGVSLSIIIRVSVFAILPIIGLALSFTAYVPNLVEKIFPSYNLLLASLPLAAAVIFGSQADILTVWMFWREDEKMTTKLSLTRIDSSSSSIQEP
ncbi:hypothetical protein B0H13DRAFT_2667954 [Mycena leptocephala]|nr:hypothetical protein B0H13DRAFT_2667954 [Mycena leptocephala]